MDRGQDFKAIAWGSNIKLEILIYIRESWID